MELTIDRLTKQYKNKIAVDRLSFSLTKGVTGLLGAKVHLLLPLPLSL